MKLSELLKYDEDLKLEKSTVVILRWIALVGQLITIYIVHFVIEFNLPLILLVESQIFLYNLTFEENNLIIPSQQYFYFMMLYNYQY